MISEQLAKNCLLLAQLIADASNNGCKSTNDYMVKTDEYANLIIPELEKLDANDLLENPETFRAIGAVVLCLHVMGFFPHLKP